MTAQGPATDFKPDAVFAGSGLGAWTVVGDGAWTAEKGEVTGKAGPAGSWLVLDRPYQDLNFFSRFRCSSPCDAGVLFRVQATAGGRTGILVSLKDGDLGTYRVTLDAAGRQLSRDRLRRRGAVRAQRAAGYPGWCEAARDSNGRGRPGRFSNDVANAAARPGSARAGRAAERVESAQRRHRLRRHPPTLNHGIDFRAGATEDRMGFGPIALYVDSGEVRFKDLAFKDLHVKTLAAEAVSPRFRMQRLDDFYYAWGAGAGDFNRDGVLDVVSGPYYYLGPAYTTRHELYVAPAQSPTANFAPTWTDYAFDFTGDGWTDVLSGESRPMTLYVNPKGENRRWVGHKVLPQITGEFTAMQDLDGDGTPEILFVTGGSGGAGGTISYAKVHPTDPAQPWPVVAISAPGLAHGHGLGTGDINGDGRSDVVQAAGWWEQPARGATGPWPYHPVAFGRWGRAEGAGGALMAVYDVNGDRLNDVVTGLNAHGFGLAWFEQKPNAGGAISFVRHMIIDDYSTRNAGDVTMSEMHAAAVADVDGDGIPDFITGKRVFSHQESYVDPDPYGLPALYWFRTVRNPAAPGGAEFVPELIHNRSGVGAQFTAVDLDKDGRVDIITATNRGTFIFFGIR